MIKQLRRNDLLKLAQALELPLIDIQKLAVHKIIDIKGAVETLILHDWKQMKWEGALSSKEIIRKICREYECSISKVTGVIYAKNFSSDTHCAICGVKIKYVEYKRNAGLCDVCHKASQIIE